MKENRVFKINVHDKIVPSIMQFCTNYYVHTSIERHISPHFKRTNLPTYIRVHASGYIMPTFLPRFSEPCLELLDFTNFPSFPGSAPKSHGVSNTIRGNSR